MSKIFCLVGKSGSGKDTLFSKIIDNSQKKLVPIIPHTTRPKRSNEIDGLTYHFVSDEQLKAYVNENKIIEKREYNTIKGIWTYFTLKFDLDEKQDYIMITTLAGAKAMQEHYGTNATNIVYLHINDHDRLLRCIEREKNQANPNYAEICRRFLADQEDFSEENLSEFKNVHRIDTAKPIEESLNEWNRIVSI